ncbi:MAG: hypothetical protein ACJ76B_04090 [Solirubrobacterales bacterium]
MGDASLQARVITYILELPFALPIPNDWQMAPLLERSPAWEGWAGEDLWTLLEWPGAKEIPENLMPGTQIRFRRARVKSIPPLRAADEAFGDKVLPFLNWRERLRRRRGLRSADRRGVTLTRSVVSLSSFIPPSEVPGKTGREEELEWLRSQFFVCLADLNRFLTALSMTSRDWRIGRLSAGQLPPLLPVIIDHVSPGEEPGQWPIHCVVSIRPELLDVAVEGEPPPDFAWQASAMVSAANKGAEPYLQFFSFVEDAWAYSLLGEATRCIITLGMAVEGLVSTTVREGAERLGWSAEEREAASAAWLKECVTVHLAKVLNRKIRVDDPGSIWGTWWSTTYQMRNGAVHEGQSYSAADAVRAKEATSAVMREIRSDLAAHQRLTDLADALKVDFPDEEHDYRWEMVQILPASLRRAEKELRRTRGC